MAKQKFNIIESTCIPVEIDNCNTDLIIPARYLASTTRDPKFFGDAFMHDLRYDAEGKPVPDFVMNRPEYSEAPREGVHEIIIGGQNADIAVIQTSVLVCSLFILFIIAVQCVSGIAEYPQRHHQHQSAEESTYSAPLFLFSFVLSLIVILISGQNSASPLVML